MITMKMAHPGSRWRKSSHSDRESNCVEVGQGGRDIAVRDTKDPHGPALAFSQAGWLTFTRRVKEGAAETI
jgi:hypothetical protein